MKRRRAGGCFVHINIEQMLCEEFFKMFDRIEDCMMCKQLYGAIVHYFACEWLIQIS
jgi:hypothetical protein